MQGFAGAHEYLRFVVTLTAVVDPFLAVPFFLAFTSTYGDAERRAHAIAVRLGTTGLNIATRILGLLLAAMAVQTMAEGLKALFPGLA